jgi:hypothetical protein
VRNGKSALRQDASARPVSHRAVIGNHSVHNTEAAATVNGAATFLLYSRRPAPQCQTSKSQMSRRVDQEEPKRGAEIKREVSLDNGRSSISPNQRHRARDDWQTIGAIRKTTSIVGQVQRIGPWRQMEYIIFTVRIRLMYSRNGIHDVT